ncbi:MATE family efflux transporter [Prevotella sp.]|uniref:MATE family efflux transporter n=1 Tax=Prevotella sp. TaxID=59823 RepID=UPI002E76ED3D|nr:MATE family efflux transporter [Prevotella sp.]MEE0669501.1 MATE family efflux transporter [Prevotella sp.]
MKTQHRDNYEFLTQAPVSRVILTMAVPTIVSMLVTCLYTIVDTYFVGQLNTQSTAAVGIVFSLMCLIQAIGSFFGHGSGSYMSRELGARRIDNAASMAATGFVYAIITGVAIAAVGLISLQTLSLWLGSTATVLPYTEQYMAIILIGTPFQIASFTLNSQLRMQGNTRHAMWGIVSGAVLNVLLDPLLIFGCSLGLRGAAIATVIGQAVSFLILYIMCNRRGATCVGIHLTKFSLRWHYVREIIYGGSPSLSRQGLASISVVLLNLAAASYGDAAVAAMSIVSRVTMFVMSVIVGFGQGFQPFCGYCYGAGLYARLRQGYWFTVKTGFVFLAIFAAVVYCFAEQTVALFRDDAIVIAVGSTALRWHLVAYPLNAYIMTSNMMLQTTRRPLRANLLASARRGLVFIPFILLLPHLFGLMGVAMCQAVCDVVTFLLAIPIMRLTFKELV